MLHRSKGVEGGGRREERRIRAETLPVWPSLPPHAGEVGEKPSLPRDEVFAEAPLDWDGLSPPSSWKWFQAQRNARRRHQSVQTHAASLHH